jgi:hypothetical protein
VKFKITDYVIQSVDLLHSIEIRPQGAARRTRVINMQAMQPTDTMLFTFLSLSCVRMQVIVLRLFSCIMPHTTRSHVRNCLSGILARTNQSVAFIRPANPLNFGTF